MKINLIRLANSLDPKAPYLKDSEQFIEDLNNELYDFDIELVNDEKDTQFSIIFIETGGSEQKFVKIYESLDKPIILLSNSKNNSLPACFEIKTFLDSKKIPHTLLYGDEKHIASSIDKLANMIVSTNKIKNSKLGVIGEPSDWLIASKVDYKEVKNKFGIELVDISINELKKEIELDPLDKIPHLAELSKKTKDKKTLEGAIKIYSGLKRIVKKHKLSGFTLRCFDLIKEYKNTACLAFALLNEEGIIATCEGDVPSLITMYIIKAASKLPSFQANPSKIDLKNNTVLFSHCTLPLNMCKEYELMTHFESGLGIGVRGKLENKPITIFKIAPNLNTILLLQGEIIENKSYENYCRTQILVKFEDDFMFDFIRLSFGNHICIVYGDILELLLPFLQMYKLIPEAL